MLLVERYLVQKGKAQFRRGGAETQFLRLTKVHLPKALVDLIEHMANASHLLVGSAQTQLLLMFKALPKMEDSLEWKMKGHSVAREYL